MTGVGAWAIWRISKTHMWFKTRVGFINVSGPAKILVTKYAKFNSWVIYASLAIEPQMTLKAFLGIKGSARFPALTLACFSDGPDARKSISQWMARIETALLTNAQLCDLSQAGEAQAWDNKWAQIQWAGESSSADASAGEKGWNEAHLEDAATLSFDRSSLVKPVARNQRLPIAIMSGFVCCLLVSSAWYLLVYQPASREHAYIVQQLATLQAAQERDEEAAVKARANADRL